MKKPKMFRVDYLVTTFVTAKNFTEAMKKGRKAVAKGKVVGVKFEYAIGSDKSETHAEFMKAEDPKKDL